MRFSYTLPWNREGRWAPRTETIELGHTDPDDVMLRRLGERGTFYEIELLEHLAVRGPVGGTVIDVGANIGNHAVYFGKFIADHVIAVEPSPVARSCLQANLEANAVAHATIVPCGVGARAGRAAIVVPPEHPNNLGATRLSVDAADDADDVVAVATLDEIVERHASGERITLVKIDVEGMELDVLHGAERLLRDQRPQLCIELGTRDAYEQVSRHLQPLGYGPRGCFCATPTYHFAVPDRHPARPRPSALAYKLGRSWTRGALRRLRGRTVPG